MTNAMPKVTVAMATYNGATHLREQLASIYAQTHPSLDVLVCDDGSTDGTLELLEEYAAQGRLTLHRGGQKLGPALNFGRAMALAETEYVALCDQDDIWDRDKIERCLRQMRSVEEAVGKQTPVLVYTDARTIDASGRETCSSLYKHLRRDPTQNGFSRLLAGNIVWGCTTFMNRALVDAALPVPACAPMHDSWLAIVAGALGVVSYLAEPTLKYRQHSTNVFGATRPSTKRKLVKALRSGLKSEEYRQRTIARRAQTVELLERFGNKLNAEKRALVQSYIDLMELGFWSRRRTILAKHFLRHSLMDNLELLVRI